MKKYSIWILLLCVAAFTQVTLAQSAAFELTSASIPANGVLNAEQIANGFGCTGGNVSPELSWAGAPEGTKSFGLTVYDPDAPTGSGFWHWVIFNIPATASSLPAGAGDLSQNLAPAGSIQSHNDAGVSGYLGPCPPQDSLRPHRYVITLFALSVDAIPLDDTAAGALAGFYLNANALASTTLTALYQQPSSFQLTSTSVADDSAFTDEQIANGFGCTGGNVSPELSWAGAPEGTKSFGLTVYDLDAPTGSGFWHWVIFNIPATVSSLPASAGDLSQNLAPAGSVQSHNDAGVSGYLGPCPPQGDHSVHHYLITLFALGVDALPLDDTAAGGLAGFYLNANALATTTLVVTYQR